MKMRGNRHKSGGARACSGPASG